MSGARLEVVASKLASLSGAAAALAIAGIIGGYVAGVALHDPDTCWLLALGRWMWEHGRLPRSDPFSYTYSLVWGDQPVVLYQWLAEAVFFLAYKASSLTGLLAASAVVLAAAFYVLPVRILCLCGMGTWPALCLALLVVLSASFHFLVRPEIFSYLCLALCIELLVATDSAQTDRSIRWDVVGRCALLMTLWCNLHSGFVLGLILQLLYAMACLVVFAASPRQGARVNGTVLVVPAACLLATMINPWGASLWMYLPRLFFPRFNEHIVELKPLSASQLADPTYYPFLAMIVLGVLFLRRGLRAGPTSAFWFATFCFVVAAGGGISARRLIPFAALFMLAGVALIHRAAASQHGNGAANADRRLQAGWQLDLSKILNPAGARWPVGMLLMAGLGSALMSSWIVPPELPQASTAFRPPRRALAFLAGSMPPGRLLNDAQFGDVMIWQMSPRHLLFIDTRFDMYGHRLVSDYRSMVRAEPGWRQLLDEYKIAWIFLKPEAALVSALKGEAGWRLTYKDDEAVIMVRTPEARSGGW